MKQFSSIEKLDRSILYALELASSVSILLLAFGLIASMANVLTKGAVYSGLPLIDIGGEFDFRRDVLFVSSIKGG